MLQTDLHPTITLILQIWAGLGPIVGGAVGHLISKSQERDRWLRDVRRDEYKELLSELSSWLVSLNNISPGQQPDIEAQSNATRVLKDRLYITPELEKMKIEPWFLNICDDIGKARKYEFGLGDTSMYASCRSQLEMLIIAVAEMGRANH